MRCSVTMAVDAKVIDPLYPNNLGGLTINSFSKIIYLK